MVNYVIVTRGLQDPASSCLGLFPNIDRLAAHYPILVIYIKLGRFHFISSVMERETHAFRLVRTAGKRRKETRHLYLTHSVILYLLLPVGLL